MCGINGFTFKDEALIGEMNESLAYRGPDGRGQYVDDDVSLGQVRLSIIDLDKRADQPMRSDDGRFEIVFNGEIYNYQDLKKDLSDYNYKTTSDTEVILAAYKKWGSDCFEKFNGIFALAIWDKKESELILARDHFGVKPLFYYFDDSKLIFSSEIKGLLAHNVNRDLDRDALSAYFRLLYVPGPRTIFKNISKLPAASFLKFREGKISIEKYWELSDVSDNSLSKEDTRLKLKKLLSKSVKAQMVADVPVGVFLSGGLDSTTVLALARKETTKKLKTFSVGFDLDKQFERFNTDYNLARKTAKHFATEHHDIKLSEQDVLDNLEKVVYHMDDLVSNPTQVANMILSRMASRELKVVLGGDGGDELFGGYRRYYYYDLVSRWQKLPSILRENLLLEKSFSSLGKADAYRRLNMEVADLHWSFMARKEKLLDKFLLGDVADLQNAKKYFRDAVASPEVFENKNIDFKKLMKLDLDTWLVDFSLAGTDKICMANGLEQRVPFLDRELAEFAYTIPSSYMIGGKNQGKQILKEAIQDEIPEFILNKPKSGWFVPISKWLRRGLKDYAYHVLSDEYNNGQTSEYVDLKQARDLLDAHIRGGAYALDELWSLLVFQIWFHKFIR